MTWLGAPLFFLVDFFCCSRSFFCSNRKLLWKGFGHRNYSTSFITSDNVFAKHNFAACSFIWGLWLHSETLSYASDPRLGNAAECGALLTLHDVRILWNFKISKSYFSFNMSQMAQFQRTPFNIRNNANAFFASVAETSSRLFWWLFNVFSVIRSGCISINLERNSYFFHTFFRVLWTFFIVGGSHCY